MWWLLWACVAGGSDKPGGGTGTADDTGPEDTGPVDTAVMCTGQRGIALSTDAGTTWDSPEPDGHDGCWGIAVLEDDGVVGVCDRGNGWSADGGCTWTGLEGGDDRLNGIFADGDQAWAWTYEGVVRIEAGTATAFGEGISNAITVGRTLDGIVVATQDARVHLLDSTGTVSEVRAAPAHDSEQFQLVHAAIEDDVVALFVRTSPSSYALFRSMDGGRTWTPLTLPGTPDPEEPGGLLLDQGRLFVSFDGLLLYPPSAVEPTVLDSRWLVPLGVPPSEPDTLWVGTGLEDGLDVGTVEISTATVATRDWPWAGGRAVQLQWTDSGLWAAHLLSMNED